MLAGNLTCFSPSTRDLRIWHFTRGVVSLPRTRESNYDGINFHIEKYTVTDGITMKRIIVRDTWLKLALFFACSIAFFLISLPLAINIFSDTGTLVAPGLIMVLIVYGLTRIFRSPGEPDAPRPFWKMTNSKLGGWLCALLFALSSFRIAFSDGPTPAIYIPAAAYLLLSVFFIISAIKAEDHSDQLAAATK